MSSPFSVDKTELMLRVLDRYGVQIRSRLGWQPVHCINAAGHSHGDRNPSASVNLTHGRYMCHACQMRGDGFQLMLDIEQMEAKQVLIELGLTPNGEPKKEPTWIL